ncbi:hypothetical protein [Halalkalicoccus sp. NIPERK01]|uniref:hypothetical protein n=1 Tax=Halalkalicoccus sp. NIPERK01 TaxID=3053469 RepID=UPI00256EFF7E|nr:hypothetical protein [Halalkalicoccus sp. NIPERK01]MDL5361986.1 hypothetical protein [Halalkalicoccus sp. NIPERK01]
MFDYFGRRHLLALVCALLVLTAGCTDAGSDGEAPIDEPDTAEAGVDADEEAGDGGGTTRETESDADETADGDDSGPDGSGSDDANDANDASDGGSADDPDETSDESGGSDADGGETTAADDGSNAGDSGTEDASDEGSDGSDAEEPAEGGESGGESDADGETPTENGSDGAEETSEPPAFLGSDPSPEVLHEFPGHAGPSAGSPDVSDAEDVEAELAAQGVDVRSVEDDGTVRVEYATSAEDGWEPAIDEMGAVSAAFWGLVDSGHDASAVEATVTDDEGRTLYTYRIERAWLTDYLERVEAIENGTATSPADPSEEYAETVWTTVDVEV